MVDGLLCIADMGKVSIAASFKPKALRAGSR